jgi:hypothetical protein
MGLCQWIAGEEKGGDRREGRDSAQPPEAGLDAEWGGGAAAPMRGGGGRVGPIWGAEEEDGTLCTVHMLEIGFLTVASHTVYSVLKSLLSRHLGPLY